MESASGINNPQKDGVVTKEVITEKLEASQTLGSNIKNASKLITATATLLSESAAVPTAPRPPLPPKTPTKPKPPVTVDAIPAITVMMSFLFYPTYFY